MRACSGSRPAGLRWGRSNSGPEEAPVREAFVDGFWIDTHDVTNAQFATFVAETGYVTTAERTLSGVALGSLLFQRPAECAGPAERLPIVAG